MITRFMQVMFSAAENNDEELTKQVADDIENTKTQEAGEGVEDDEVSYVNLGSGKVLIIDKGTGEATVAEQNEEDPEQYDLEGFESDEELEKYLHTLEDGVTPDENVKTEVTENVEDHMTGEDVISPNLEDGGLNPDAGHEPTVEEKYCPECEEEEEEKEFSNIASYKLFSDADFYCRIFSDVLDEDKPAIIGDLKIEKADDDTLIVTDVESGDEAQVTVNDDDEFVVSDVQKELSDEEKTYSVTMTEDELIDFCKYFSDDEEEKTYSVTMTEDELTNFCKYFSDDEEEEVSEDEEEEESCPNQYEPLFVVGIDPVNHIIVDSPVYDPEDAEVLAQRLSEDGVDAIQIFENPDEARDYAVGLLGEAGVSEIEQIAEPQEHNFSDVTIYTTRYFSDCTEFMFKLFSEAEEEVTETQDNIEEAIKNGEQSEDESEVITPIDDETAVVYDKEADEYTKVTLDNDEINTQKISEEEADELTKDIEFEEEKKEDESKEEKKPAEEEKEFSVLDKFFAEVEEAEAPVASVDPSKINPETGDPVDVEPVAAPAQSVELVEDKALAAVQSIQEAANEAVLAITEAKEAPAPGEEQDLKEAQFSAKEGSADTLADWFESI